MYASPLLPIWVAAGGAVDSVARYPVMSQVGRWLGNDFPYATLAVNVVGSFILGVLVEGMAPAWNLSEEVRVFLTVGVLGGFTTFSTFSMDAALLMEKHQHLQAWIYIVASVALCVAVFFAGLRLVRWVLV
jgi:CrcB protein